MTTEELIRLTVLAIVQGVTEFLPISSSAHLILLPAVFGWQDQGLTIDVALHLGTLIAVLVYFRRDCARLARGAADLMRRRVSTEARLTGQIAIATLPVVVTGSAFHATISTDFRAPLLIASTTGTFAILLLIADRKADKATSGLASLSWCQAGIIGVAQALALVPGVSRSGITMTAALLLGLTRSEAARFSLLLSVPVTAAAGVLTLSGLATTVVVPGQIQQAAIAGGLAFLSALGALAGLMNWLRRATFRPFIIYRLVLAILICALVFSGFLPD